jgi:hypothetical protein
MERDVKIVRQFDKVFQIYCVLFKELEREQQLALQCSCKENKTQRNTKIIFGWRSVT